MIEGRCSVVTSKMALDAFDGYLEQVKRHREELASRLADGGVEAEGGAEEFVAEKLRWHSRFASDLSDRLLS